MIKETDTTTFDLSEYDAEPFELDYTIYKLDFDDDAPDGSWCTFGMNRSISPEPVEVVDNMLEHIGQVKPGWFKELLEIVKQRYYKLSEDADVRDFYSD